jgi:hypothetical protein
MTYAHLIRHCAALIVALSGAAALAPATAADSPSPTATASDKLATARALIADGKWAAAIEELKKVNDSGSADWNNLMGYSHRKAKSPDFAPPSATTPRPCASTPSIAARSSTPASCT